MNVRMDRNVNPVIEETCLLGVFFFVLFCFVFFADKGGAEGLVGPRRRVCHLAGRSPLKFPKKKEKKTRPVSVITQEVTRDGADTL